MHMPLKVLFLCTGNSARGSHPVGRVNPFALEPLHESRIDLFRNLRHGALDRHTLQVRVGDIGTIPEPVPR